MAHTLIRMASFEKVSERIFAESFRDLTGDAAPDRIRAAYDKIRIPCRATTGSAGYDFFSTVSFTLSPGGSVTIPTGIRVKMDPGWVLMLFPRSGLGFKYRLQLANTVGVIDSDYYDSDNEGHIMVRLTNDSKDGRTVAVSEGGGFAQGVFLPFGITFDDDVRTARNGGFGSTD